MMLSVDIVVAQLPGLVREDLERWIANEWIRADRQEGQYLFCEIDLARVRLIQELRDEMQVNEEALPVVLSLLDQLHDLRRILRELHRRAGPSRPGAGRLNGADHQATRPA